MQTNKTKGTAIMSMPLSRSDTNTSRRLLLVESHGDDLTSLAGAFGEEFDVTLARSGKEAELCIRRGRFDAIVMDPDLPDMDGLSLVSKATEGGKTVALVLSGATDDLVPQKAFESGAADFAYKPIRGNELLVRLKQAFSRLSGPGNGAARLTLKREERICHLDGRDIPLTRHERDFLACLVDAPRHFSSYEDLIAAVWGDPKAVETQHLRVLAAQVRRKLASAQADPDLIQTVVGEGYRLKL